MKRRGVQPSQLFTQEDAEEAEEAMQWLDDLLELYRNLVAPESAG